VGGVNLGELTNDTIDVEAEVSDEEVTDEEESSSEESSTSESTEDESDESEHEGSGYVNGNGNGKAIAVSPTLLPPSQSTSNNHDYDNKSSQRSTPQVLRSPTRPQPTVLRKKSFSLKKSKSMNLSLTNLSFSKKSNDAPPVPPLLRSKTLYPPVPSSKPLPLDPTPQDAMEELPPPTPSKDAPPVRQQQPPQRNKPSIKTKPKKTPPQALKPPELEHIPKLLPVFAEIMRPLLLVRKGSSS